MNIVNINSLFGITTAQKTFTEDILSCGDYLNKDTEVQCSFYWLSKDIPIFLVNENTMEGHNPKIEVEYEYNHDYEFEYEYKYNKKYIKKPSTDWLGFYQRRSDCIFNNTPIIVVCPERIAEHVANDKDFMILFSKVIVHEFSHAKMDYCEDNIDYGIQDEFFHWIEESMANLLTINAFKAFESGFGQSMLSNRGHDSYYMDFIFDFIKMQPPPYALACELYKNSIEEQWINWSNYKGDLGESSKSSEKKKWLAYMKKNYLNIDKRTSEELYKNLFC